MSVSGAFDKLPKKLQDAVRLVFEHNLTNGEIAKIKAPAKLITGAILI